MTSAPEKNIAVLYNGACPVCGTEMAHYKKISRAEALPIRFDDLNDLENLKAWRIDPETAARKLHVRKNGKILIGVAAFVALWGEMPKYRWLSKLVSLPGVFQISELIYNNLLAPMLYRKHVKRIGLKTNTL